MLENLRSTDATNVLSAVTLDGNADASLDTNGDVRPLMRKVHHGKDRLLAVTLTSDGGSDHSSFLEAHSQVGGSADQAVLLHEHGDVPISNPVCVTYQAAIGVLKGSMLTRRALVFFLGLYSSLKAWKVTLPACLSVVQGIDKGVWNVKSVFPMTTLPGYVLSFSVLAFLPGLMVVMAFISQAAGCLPMSLAVSIYVYGISCLAMKGYKMTVYTTRSKFEKYQKSMAEWMSKVQMLAGIVLVIYACYLASIVNAEKPGAEELRENADMINIRALFGLNVGLTIAETVMKFFMFKYMNTLVATDTLIVSIFDSADDALEAKAKRKGDAHGGKREDEKELFKQWKIEFPNKSKNKKEKKKKKDKGEKGEGGPEWTEGQDAWGGKGAYGEADGWQQGPQDYQYGGYGQQYGGYGPSAAQTGFFPQ